MHLRAFEFAIGLALFQIFAFVVLRFAFADTERHFHSSVFPIEGKRHQRVAFDGRIKLPQDVFVIVIGGAKLSRGLTIEGLCITYFTRWNPSPTEDTVLQLSRWYGYRGGHLEFCRLFTTRAIYDQLCDMEENDRELREALATLMRIRKSPSDAALVISSNPRALPKIGRAHV